MTSLDERLRAFEAVLADPPQVHPAAQLGVWATDMGAYRFMASQCGPGTRTLETGLGMSTVVFALWGAQHTCVVPSQEEVDVLRAHCDERDIDLSSVRFEVATSDRRLPTLEGPELDLLLVDGCHAFPVPIIDWYYAGARLRSGGHVILDDVNLTPVSLGLVRFLDRDPRWTRVARKRKWAAYRRESEGTFDDEWMQQAFLDRRFGARRIVNLSRGLAKRVLRRQA